MSDVLHTGGKIREIYSVQFFVLRMYVIFFIGQLMSMSRVMMIDGFGYLNNYSLDLMI